MGSIKKDCTMKTKERLDYIDIAKGFAIALMVFGHTYSSDVKVFVMTWVYSFHMPLFFLTTGILYGLKNKNAQNIKYGLIHKCKTLLLPYFFWNTLYQLFISALAVIGGASAKETIISKLRLVILFGGSAMWFLPAMFIAVCIFLITLKNKRLNIIIAFIAFFIGILTPECNNIFNACLRALIGLSFIVLGYYGARFFSQKIKSLYILIVFAVSLLAVFSNGMVSIASRTFNNPLLYVISACLGTFVVYQISMRLKRDGIISRLLKLWGKNSIKVLCLHGFVIQVIRIFDYKVLGDILPSLGKFEGVIFTAVVMAIFTIFMPIINKWFNWSFGIEKCAVIENKK